jgi:hypothetical protein
VKKLPKSDNSLLLRTDFSDDAAWTALCEAVQAPSDEGFEAHVECISDPAFRGLTIEQLLDLTPKGSGHLFVFLADRRALSDSERPVLVVDLDDEPGRTFRVVPGSMWSVENNLSLSNLDYDDFADSVDADGVFRGFPRT